METSASLLYKRLNPDTSEIRLLEIPPDGSKCWGLVTVSLDDNPKYAALSYVWGEPDDPENINVQGQDTEVTPNLADALSRIQSGSLGEPSTPMKYLWADAICINQEDDEERSQQVQLMYRIFSCAQIVYSWIGPDDYSLAFETIKTLAHEVAQHWSNNNTIDNGHDDLERMRHVPPFEMEWLRHHPSLCEEPTDTYHGDNKWDAVENFLTDFYWQRVWIFQEVVLARQLNMVNPGSIVLSWQELSIFAESLYKLNLRQQVNQNGVEKPAFVSRETWAHLVQCLEVDHIHQLLVAKLNERGSKNTECKDDTSLRQHWHTATSASWLIATDPRDCIYGLLGLSRIPLTPDYSKDVAEVYTDFVEGWMETGKQLGIEKFSPLGFLALAGVGPFIDTPPDNFPTWAPNFSENAQLASPIPMKHFIDGHQVFRGDLSKHPYLVRNTGSLFVWGAEIEPVLLVFKPRRKKSVPRQLLDMGFFLRDYTSRHSQYISGITSWQAIASLIHGKKSPADTRVVIVALLVLARMLSRYGKSRQPDHLGGWDSLDSFLFPNGWETRLYQLAFPGTNLEQLGFNNDPVAEIRSWGEDNMDEKKVFTWNMTTADHSFFETTGGYLGRGQKDFEEGDVLCVLKDYDHPVLLRKQGDYYTFVESVFVVDMDLEKLAQNSPSSLKWLELR